MPAKYRDTPSTPPELRGPFEYCADMADDRRARRENYPVPVFDEPAFTPAPALADATVAIVTTAALHRRDQPGFGRQRDQSYRVLDAADRDLQLGHYSPNFDRIAVAADLNVVYPIDRLVEMEKEGVLGAVAPHHLSFLGAQDETMSTIRMDTGPAAAALLLADGVDVVLLTPV